MVLCQDVTEGRTAQAPLSFLEFQIHLEDVELCRRADGSLWSLGKGSFGTGIFVEPCACTPCVCPCQHDHVDARFAQPC